MRCGPKPKSGVPVANSGPVAGRARNCRKCWPKTSGRPFDLLRRKVGREVQEGQSPSWAELRSNSAACERASRLWASSCRYE